MASAQPCVLVWPVSDRGFATVRAKRDEGGLCASRLIGSEIQRVQFVIPAFLLRALTSWVVRGLHAYFVLLFRQAQLVW